MRFELLHSHKNSRLGRLVFNRGTIDTPAFMPVGTYGSVKTMSSEELNGIGYEIILSNTFHLMLRPGMEVIRSHQGLHDFMNWKRPILTDSGGFQVYSLKSLTKIDEEGVEFRSPVNGDLIKLTPELSISIQHDLSSDIVMVFDECTPYPVSEKHALSSMELSLRWAKRSMESFKALKKDQQSDSSLFGIIQGGVYPKLRAKCCEALKKIDFDGYALGGLAVGETEEERIRTLEAIGPYLPIDKPRYLMGVGTPMDIMKSVLLGIDMFDCVIPTRHARNGQLFTSEGRINLKNSRYRMDKSPVDEKCLCITCQNYTRSYLSHLHRCNEILGAHLSTIHNLQFYYSLMAEIRQAISKDSLDKLVEEYLNQGKID